MDWAKEPGSGFMICSLAPQETLAPSEQLKAEKLYDAHDAFPTP